MSRFPWNTSALLILTLAVGAAGGYWLVPQNLAQSSVVSATPEGKPLYWYDPMVPQQHFDAPGKSPFMDMQLVPRYADAVNADDSTPAVRIEPGIQQNLGVRLASVTRGTLDRTLQVTGVLAFNDRMWLCCKRAPAASSSAPIRLRRVTW